MKTVKTFARQLSFSLMMAMTLGSAIVSCGSILDEEDVDCSVEYRVKFKYDYNMKYADASHARWGLLRFMLLTITANWCIRRRKKVTFWVKTDIP